MEHIYSTTTKNIHSSVETTSEAEFKDFIKSNINTKRPPVISDEARFIFQVVNYVSICGFISTFGIASNVINIIVFAKLGFKDSMNINLLGLAVADLLCLLTMMWTSISFNPLYMEAAVTFDPLDVMYLSGGWPHECFNRITGFTTAYITFERCLCITMPLKVKAIITPRRAKGIILGIFGFMLLIFSPFYAVNRLKYQLNVSLNRTVLSIFHTENRYIVESATFFIHSVALSAISLFTVIICTIILVINLNEKSKWRQSNATQAALRQERVSAKDKKVMKMITLISTIFIICYIPPTCIFFMMAYDPEFAYSGTFENAWFSVWSVAFVVETINSSVNIFVYYNMSSKFKATFLQMLCISAEE